MARTSTKEFGHIYGEVNSAEDIRRINRIIRQEMDTVTTREELTELREAQQLSLTSIDRLLWAPAARG